MPDELGAPPSSYPVTRALLLEPDGRIYPVGGHLSYVNAWIEGAIQSAWYQGERLLAHDAGGAIAVEDGSRMRVRLSFSLVAGLLLAALVVSPRMLSLAQDANPAESLPATPET